MAEPTGPSSGRANSRAALVAAALAEFTEKGYEAANVADIADRAGVTTGALYAHFRGKLDLLLATLNLRPVDDFASGAPGAAPDRPWPRMAQRLAADLSAPPSPETLLLLDVVVLARRDTKLAATIRRLLGLKLEELTAATEAGHATGVFASNLTAADLARMLVLLTFGKMVLAAIEEPVPGDVAFARIADALFRPVGSEGVQPSLEGVAWAARQSQTARAEFEARVREAVRDGHSLRQVGDAAGVSHEQIRRIVAARSR